MEHDAAFRASLGDSPVRELYDLRGERRQGDRTVYLALRAIHRELAEVLAKKRAYEEFSVPLSSEKIRVAVMAALTAKGAHAGLIEAGKALMVKMERDTRREEEAMVKEDEGKPGRAFAAPVAKSATWHSAQRDLLRGPDAALFREEFFATAFSQDPEGAYGAGDLFKTLRSFGYYRLTAAKAAPELAEPYRDWARAKLAMARDAQFEARLAARTRARERFRALSEAGTLAQVLRRAPEAALARAIADALDDYVDSVDSCALSTTKNNKRSEGDGSFSNALNPVLENLRKKAAEAGKSGPGAVVEAAFEPCFVRETGFGADDFSQLRVAHRHLCADPRLQVPQCLFALAGVLADAVANNPSKSRCAHLIATLEELQKRLDKAAVRLLEETESAAPEASG